MTTKNKQSKHVPMGTALRCEHNCCGGIGVPPVTIARDNIEALYAAQKEFVEGLEDFVSRLRAPKPLFAVDFDDLDSSLAEATAAATEIRYALAMALGIDEDKKKRAKKATRKDK